MPPLEGQETELEVSQSQDNSLESTQPEESQASEETTISWTLEREQELEQRLREGGEVQDEELEGYDEWVKSGKPTPEPDDVKPDEKEDKELEAKEPEAGSEVDSSESEEEVQSEEEIKSLTEAMKAVGAKTVDELPAKIQGLRSQLGKQGGELGTQLKEAQQQNQNMAKLMEDLIAGKPEAIQHVQQIHPDFKGVQVSTPTTPQETKDVSPDDFLDDKLYEYVKGLEAKVNELQGYQQSSQEKASQVLAVQQTVNDISGFVRSNPEYFDAAGDITPLLNDYFLNQTDNDPVDPRLTKVHNLLVFAKENGLKNLDDAHWLMNKDNLSQRLIEAKKEGRQSALNYKPNPALSSQRKQGFETQYKSYTDGEIADIVAGRKEIPDEWTDAAGNWIPDRIPAAAKKYITHPGM